MSYHTNSCCIILTKLSHRRRTAKDDDGFTLVCIFSGICPWNGVYLCTLFSVLITIQTNNCGSGTNRYTCRLISCDNWWYLESNEWSISLCNYIRKLVSVAHLCYYWCWDGSILLKGCSIISEITLMQTGIFCNWKEREGVSWVMD